MLEIAEAINTSFSKNLCLNSEYSETTRLLILAESWARRSFREYEKDCVVKHE